MVFPRPTSSASIAPLDKRRLECEKRGLNLVRVEIDLGIQKGGSKLSSVSHRMAPTELVRVELGVVLGRHSLALASVGDFIPATPASLA